MTIAAVKLKKRLEKYWLVIVLSIIFVILNAIITVNSVLPIISNLYKNTIGEKQELYKKILLLKPEVNVDYFKSILGIPVFINNKENVQEREYIFVNKYFYVVATTDFKDRVLYFAVTTRVKDFTPNLLTAGYSTNKPSYKIELRKTKFSEITDDPEDFGGCLGARRFYYFEKYYFGNPGNYSTYVFAINDAGFSTGDISKLDDIKYFNCQNDSEFKLSTLGSVHDIDSLLRQEATISGLFKEEPLKSFRKETVINTYIVSAPFEGYNFDINWVGVNYDQVRIVN